jgi:hypothetical protein
MGNQNTTHTNRGLGDGQAVITSFRCTKGQRKKLKAMADGAGLDKSAYIRARLGLDEAPDHDGAFAYSLYRLAMRNR